MRCVSAIMHWSVQPDCEKSSSPAVTSVSASCGEESGCSQECRVEGGEAVSYYHPCTRTIPSPGILFRCATALKGSWRRVAESVKILMSVERTMVVVMRNVSTSQAPTCVLVPVGMNSGRITTGVRMLTSA